MGPSVSTTTALPEAMSWTSSSRLMVLVMAAPAGQLGRMGWWLAGLDGDSLRPASPALLTRLPPARFVVCARICITRWLRTQLSGGYAAGVVDESAGQSGEAVPVPRLGEAELDAWRGLLNAHASVVERVEQALAEAGLPPLGWYDVL